jgi:hypothetical protein
LLRHLHLLELGLGLGYCRIERLRRTSMAIRSQSLLSADRPDELGGSNPRKRGLRPRIEKRLPKFARVPAIALMILASIPITQVHAQTPAPTATPASVVLNAGVNVLVSQASTAANYVITSSTGGSTLIFEIGDTGTQCGSNTTTLGGGSGSLVATYGALPPNVDLCVVSPVNGITLQLTAQ